MTAAAAAILRTPLSSWVCHSRCLWLEWTNRRSARRPSVAGVVIRSAVRSDDDGQCVVEFAYRFRLGGITHEASRIAYAARWPAPPVPLNLVEQFPVGHRVTVFYDPTRPSSAVIQRGTDPYTSALALAGAAVAFAAWPALWL